MTTNTDPRALSPPRHNSPTSRPPPRASSPPIAYAPTSTVGAPPSSSKATPSRASAAAFAASPSSSPAASRTPAACALASNLLGNETDLLRPRRLLRGLQGSFSYPPERVEPDEDGRALEDDVRGGEAETRESDPQHEPLELRRALELGDEAIAAPQRGALIALVLVPGFFERRAGLRHRRERRASLLELLRHGRAARQARRRLRRRDRA